MAKSLATLQAEAKALGLELVGDETVADLTEAIKIKKDEDAKNSATDPDPKPKAKKSVVFFYWVKIKTFINDTETVEPGLYQSEKEIERLKKSKAEYVETFEDEISERELFKIAELYKVNIFTKDTKKTRPVDEILDELVKEL